MGEKQILEITLLSAQNLKTKSRIKGVYAVVQVDPSTKLRTRIDHEGAYSPTWNDKFLFQVSSDFINGENSCIQVEIYAVNHLKDSLIGTARILLSTCLESRECGSKCSGFARVCPVYVHLPSGDFHGILNIAASVCGQSRINYGDLGIFHGSSGLSFHDLMNREAEKEKENSLRGKLKLLPRMKPVKSSPSLSTMLDSASSNNYIPGTSLRPVSSEPTLSTMLSTASSSVAVESQGLRD